jgi:hypothetical protein
MLHIGSYVGVRFTAMLLSFVDVVVTQGHVLSDDLNNIRVAAGYEFRFKERH